MSQRSRSSQMNIVSDTQVSVHVGKARSGKVTIEVPATLSDAKRLLAEYYRRAGFTPRQAAMKVAEVVAKVRSRAVAA